MRNSLPRAATATSRGACLAGAIIVMCGVMYVAPAATTSDSLCGTAILEDIRLYRGRTDCRGRWDQDRSEWLHAERIGHRSGDHDCRAA